MYQTTLGCLMLLLFQSFFSITSAECYDVNNDHGSFHVCNATGVNKEVELNVTQNDIWFLISNPPTKSNLLIIETTPYDWTTELLHINLFDQNGTVFSNLNYPNYTDSDDPNSYKGVTNYKFVQSPLALPFLLHLYTPNDNRNRSIGILSINLREANSYNNMDPNSVYQDTITPNSWLFRSWVFSPPINDFSYLRLSQFTSNCSASSLQFAFFTCEYPSPCDYPTSFNNFATVNGKMEDGTTVILGFPIVDNYQEIDILGIFNNDSKNCDVKTTTYAIDAPTVNISANVSSNQCEPGRYVIFYIPYDPYNGERLPPKVNITVTVTPKSSNKGRIGIFYSESQKISSTNAISASLQKNQPQDNLLEPLTLVFSSEGPFEYISVYNFGTEIAEFSISVSSINNSETPPPEPSIKWWVWLCVGIGILILILIIAVVTVVQKKAEYKMLN